MRVKRRYPLESLQTEKRRQTEESARRVGDAAARRLAVERRAAEASALHDAEKRKLSDGIESEQSRLEAGASRAVDLARAEAWRAESERRVEETAAAERSTEARVRDAARALERERDALARTRGGERAVLEHRRRWERERTLGAEKKDEEASEDAFRAREHGKKDGSR